MADLTIKTPLIEVVNGNVATLQVETSADQVKLNVDGVATDVEEVLGGLLSGESIPAGAGLTHDESGKIAINVGDGLAIDEDNRLMSTGGEYATKESYGIVQIGDGIDVENGVISANTVENYNPFVWNSAWVSQMTGSGTVVDPYLIYTPYDFNEIRNDMTAYYKLMNNLDFANVQNFVAIGDNGDGTYTEFTGGFDGNNKIIKNLNINTISQQTYGGLFISVLATLKNLCLSNCHLHTSAQNAGLFCGAGAGNFSGLKSSQCSLTSSSEVELHLAGIIGHGRGDTTLYITSCVSDCTMSYTTSTSYYRNATGILYRGGDNSQTVYIESCINRSDFTNKSWRNCFGIVNDDYAPTINVNNCLNLGHINGFYGGAIGYTHFTGSHNYCLQDCVTNPSGVAYRNCTQKTQAELKDSAIITLLNAGLEENAYFYKMNDFPQLAIDIATSGDLPIESPLVVSGVDSAKLYKSGVTLNSFYQLQANLLNKSSILPAVVTLTAAGWNGGKQTLQVDSVTTGSKLVLIPQSSDIFTNGVTISSQAAGSVTFSATTTPQNAINAVVLVIN